MDNDKRFVAFFLAAIIAFLFWLNNQGKLLPLWNFIKSDNSTVQTGPVEPAIPSVTPSSLTTDYHVYQIDPLGVPLSSQFFQAPNTLGRPA